MHTSAGRETKNERRSVEEEWADRGERWMRSEVGKRKERGGGERRGEMRRDERRRGEETSYLYNRVILEYSL